MLIDATDLVLGRLATEVAKRALKGEKIDIVNSEKAVVTGRKQTVFAHYKQRRDRGIPLKGPYYPRLADRLVRRTIRGMLPYKQAKGSEAFKRVMCYVGVPAEFKEQKADSIEQAHISKVSSLHYITVQEICKYLGA